MSSTSTGAKSSLELGGNSSAYNKGATTPLHGFAAPPKGFFASAPVNGAQSNADARKNASSASPMSVTSSTISSSTAPTSDARSPSAGHDDLPPASSPSAVPTKGRRRESIGGQMRRKISESPAAAAGVGSTVLGSSFTLRGQSIPNGRVGANGALDASSMSTSLGAAAHALNSTAGVSRSQPSGARPPVNGSRSSGTLIPPKNERVPSHTHFGQDCYGPQPGETTLAPPTSAMLASPANGDGNASNGSEDDSSNGKRGARGQSAAPSTSSDDYVGADGLSKSLSSGNAMLHKCEACNKVYRHPSCLIKHRWEHTIYWKEASKFLMSKHQQVQLLEAAAILVGMDNNARSLPEEKALWPAAVSPPSSGLLGSDRINFEKLMAQKGQYRGASREPPSPFLNGNTPSSRYTPLPSTTPQSLPYRPSANGSLPSPLDALTSLNISTPRMRGGMHNGDVQHLQLDESAERTDRSGSAETEDDDHDPDTPPDHSLSDERERSDLGAGIEIEMDMDE